MSIASSAGICAAVLAGTFGVASLGAQQIETVRVPASVLERYVGEWVYPNGNTITLSVHGDTLFREIPGQRMALLPVSETTFKMGPLFTAEFVTDQTGGITQIVKSVAVEFRLSRKGSRPASIPEPDAVRVPTSVLERYVGEYEYIAGQMKRTDLRIVVALRGDTLVRQLAAEQILIPISNTVFRVKGTTLAVEFVVDDAGVTQILGSGPQQLLARRTRKY